MIDFHTILLMYSLIHFNVVFRRISEVLLHHFLLMSTELILNDHRLHICQKSFSYIR